MSEAQSEAGSDAARMLADAAFEPATLRCGDNGTGSRQPGRPTRRSGGLQMLAVTAERLTVAGSLPGVAGYLPAIPADSEDRCFD